MEIEIYFEDTDTFSLDTKDISQHLVSLIEKESKTCGDISIIICSDEYLYEMNREYLNHDYYTDIITFDYVEDNVISGDLFISIDRVKENAKNEKVNEMNELLRVMIHGVLHLLGYKDKSKTEKDKMREKEDYYLKSANN